MDIFNGDLVTMVSSPTYDPNAFVHGIEKKYWEELLSNDKKPLNNKAISGLYPPGSTIKTIVALSALENDVWDPKNILTAMVLPNFMVKISLLEEKRTWSCKFKNCNSKILRCILLRSSKVIRR